MGGTINVTSIPGQGSSFEFTALFGLRDTSSNVTQSAERLAGISALIVDDNATALITQLKDDLQTFERNIVKDQC
jgi:hypothetical protein